MDRHGLVAYYNANREVVHMPPIKGWQMKIKDLRAKVAEMDQRLERKINYPGKI